MTVKKHKSRGKSVMFDGDELGGSLVGNDVATVFEICNLERRERGNCIMRPVEMN